MGSRDLDAKIWALQRHHGHVGSMLDSDWSRQKLLRCDWSVPTVACITTNVTKRTPTSIKRFIVKMSFHLVIYF